MHWLEQDEADEELLTRLEWMSQNKPVMRPEYVKYVNQLLLQKSRQMQKRYKLLRAIRHTGMAAAAMLLAVWVGTQINMQSEVVRKSAHVIPNDAERMEILETRLHQGSDQKQGKVQPNPPLSGTSSVRNPTDTGKVKLPMDAVSKTAEPKPADPKPAKTMPILESKARGYLQQKLGYGEKEVILNSLRSRPQDGTFVFNPAIDGIPFLDQTLHMSLNPNGDLLSITSFGQQLDLNQLSFPSAAGIISSEKAEQMIAGRMRLVYQERLSAKKTPLLLYKPLHSGDINAVEGQFLPSDASGVQGKSDMIPVVPQGRKLYAASSEEAISLLRNEFGFSVAEDETEFVRVRDLTREEKGYQLSLKEGTLTLRTLKETGQVTGFEWAVKDASQKEKKPIEEKAALVEGLQFLQKYLDPGIKALQLKETEKTSSAIRFRFYKVHEGIPVIDHIYQVTVDTSLGRVVEMSGSFASPVVALPDRNGIVSVERAAKEYNKKFPPQLAYIVREQPGTQKTAVYLVYRTGNHPGERLGINAKTGKAVAEEK